MDLPVVLGVAAVAGFCAKFSDEVADRKIPLYEAFAAALLWGILAGFLAAGGALSSLFLAMAIATILAGKFDHALHHVGLIAFAIVIWLLPLQAFEPWVFSLFLVAALLDELELKWPVARHLSYNRLFLPLSALIAGIWSGQMLYLAAILLFDTGYKISDYVCARIFSPKHIAHISAQRAHFASAHAARMAKARAAGAKSKKKRRRA